MLRSLGNIRICTGKATVFINLRIGKRITVRFAEFLLKSFHICWVTKQSLFPHKVTYVKGQGNLLTHFMDVKKVRLVGIQKGYLCRCSVHVCVKSNPQLLQRFQKCDNKIRFQAVVNDFKFDQFKGTLTPSARKFS